MTFSLEAVSHWTQKTAVVGGCPRRSAVPTGSPSRAGREGEQVVLELGDPLPLGSPAERVPEMTPEDTAP